MRLSRRIYAIKDQVNIGETAADIGTDHGYVPMLLMRDGISPAVIMSDISGDSLSKARETFELCGISVPETSFRVGDGLDTIEPGEVNDIIIAGLGGLTITGILDADLTKSRSFKKLILQPRKHSGNLRYYLYTRGWDIISEALAPEGKFVCEIITASPAGNASDNTEAAHCEETLLYRDPPYPEDDIRWKYPAAIVEADRDLAARRIGWKISSITEQIESLAASRSDASRMIERLTSDREYLHLLLNY